MNLNMYKPVKLDFDLTHKNIYAFNPNRKFRWFQRFAIWILAKLDCQYISMETNISYVEIDIDKLFDMITDSQYALGSILRKEAGYVVLGGDQMTQLQIEAGTYMSFNVPSDYQSRIYYNNQRISVNGLRVILIPWFDGIVVLPKEL